MRVLRARRAPGRSLPILRRPRVARAQKIIRLHPLLCSGSTEPTWVSFQSFSSCAFCEQEGWAGGSLSHPSETARCTSTGDHLVCPRMLLPGLLVPSPQGEVWIYPLLRASTEHILIVHTSDIQMILPSSLVVLPRKSIRCWFYCGRRAILQMTPPSLLVLSPQGVVWIYPLLRASTEHILIVRGLRAGGIDQTSPHVSIISNRASNSCPQAVQRIQSDSTANSSDLIPMPPQSGQRARWTF